MEYPRSLCSQPTRSPHIEAQVTSLSGGSQAFDARRLPALPVSGADLKAESRYWDGRTLDLDGRIAALLHQPTFPLKQPVTNYIVPTPYLPVQTPQQTSSVQQQQSPKLSPGGAEETAYVNPKQFRRILVRRKQREEAGKQRKEVGLDKKERKSYQHESRHNHAVRRPRGPGGRFLSAEETAQMEKQNAAGRLDRLREEAKGS